MYQQQEQSAKLLPHERVNAGGCVISGIVILLAIWLFITFIDSITRDVGQWLLVTIMCYSLSALLTAWLIIANKRQREVHADRDRWSVWQQQQRQANLAYQDQQMQRFYASLEAQQGRQEEQRRRERLAQEEQQRRSAEQWRRQKEQERKERLTIIQLSDLLVLSPKQFEHRVADLFVSVGYRNVQRTGGSGDLMADITCTSPEGEKVVVQCKRYERDHKVSSPEIQKFAGMVFAYHKADKAIFITTSAFTEPAIKLGKVLHIELIDGERLCQFFVSRTYYNHLMSIR